MAKTTTHPDYTATGLTITTAAQPNITSLGTLTSLSVGGTLAATGVVTANAGVVVDNITIDGTEIDLSSGDLTLDVAGDIILDAGGQNIYFDDDGTRVFSISQVSSDVYLGAEVQDKDLIFRGNDGGSAITALTLDMSDAGSAYFNNKVGIGTTSPAALLHLSGDSDNGDEACQIVLNDEDSSAGSRVPSIQFKGNNTNIGRIRGTDTQGIIMSGSSAQGDDLVVQAGNVGIGTTSPSTQLHVYDGSSHSEIRVATSASGDDKVPALSFNNTAVEWSLGVKADNHLHVRENTDSYTSRVTIADGGNVGIGTEAPTEKLTVNGNIEMTSTQGRRIFMGGIAGTTFGMAYDSQNPDYGIFYTEATPDVVNISPNGNATAGVMSLFGNGRVGIGTQTVNAGLTVASADIRCTGSAVANDGNSISMSQESSGGFIAARGAHTSTRGTINLHVAGSNGGIGITGLTVANDGSVSKYSGSFKIDHPLESKKDTHHLVHSFVEGPQADNIYRGVIALENGSATINLDTVSGMTEGTFVALNTNTSCFTSNETDWDSVKGSISGNTLTISCQNTSSTATVSWLVIGERHDQHMMDANWTDDSGKVIVEPLKESNFSFLKESE